jgi:hypothetical protein
MIGAQTEPVAVPRYETAVSLIHRIASVLFAATMSVAMFEGIDSEVYLDHWWQLRRTAELIILKRSAVLTLAERDALHSAFRMAHTAHHTCPRVAAVMMDPPCACEMAGLIESCEQLLKEEGHANQS